MKKTTRTARPSRRRFLTCQILLTVCAVTFLHPETAALHSEAAAQGPETAAQRLETAAQGPSLVSQTGAGIGVLDCVVRFAQEVQVPALETGRIAEIFVAPNDTVKAGTAIARLDDRSMLIRRRASMLRLNSAENDALDHVEIRYAELALAEADAELDTSRSIQNDVRGAVPLSQMRRLKLAVERGQLEVAQAKKRMKRTEVEVQLREADLSMIDDQLKNLHTETPIGGVVLEVTRSAGEWIEKGESVATIARIDRLQVHALVASEKIAPAICRGLPVSVRWTDRSTGDEQSLRGKVLSVDPQVLPGGRFRLHAEIINRARSNDPSQWLLQPGAEVEMKVYSTSATSSKRSQSLYR
jgi:multidrug efflux pump subunit AcrA (membrane-fusion protein)